MEPVTHTLASIALGRSGLNKVTRMATPMLVVSGVIADLDWASRLGGARAFLQGHRTATHSLLGTAAIIAGVAACFWLAGRRHPKLAVQLFPAILLCTIGAAAHILLDLLNPDGVQLLWPFRADRYAWDIADSVDAWIIFFLLAGLLLPELFRIIHEEIGARPKQRGRQRGAIAGLILVTLFIAGRVYAQQRAVALLGAREYRSQAPLGVAVFPEPSSPLAWHGVVETDNALFNVEVPLGPGRAFDPDLASVHFKPQPSLVLTNAAAGPLAVEFLKDARFPLANVEPSGDGYSVRFRDMRFAPEFPGQQGIVAVIELNGQAQVISERLEFDGASKP